MTQQITWSLRYNLLIDEEQSKIAQLVLKLKMPLPYPSSLVPFPQVITVPVSCISFHKYSLCVQVPAHTLMYTCTHASSHSLAFGSVRTVIFYECAVRIFKTCNTRLLSQSHLRSFPLDNSQHSNSCLVWMNKKLYLLFRQIGKNKFFGVSQNFSN